MKDIPMARERVLVNLPSGFFKQPELVPAFERLESFAEVRKTSYDRPEEIRPDAIWAQSVLMWSWPMLDDAILDAAKDLRFSGNIDIGQRGAEILLRRGIPVSVTRRGFSPAVSEMALALILSTLRRVSDYHAAMRQGRERWVRAFPDDVDSRERELTGRAVGIVGFGAVGRRLAELLQPFRCDLRVIDPYVPESVLTALNGKRADIPTMVRDCDVVVLCASSNAGTKHLLGAEEISALRPDAVLVNVARAALVDTQALVRRLEKGHLCTAIDVFDQEPLPADSPLRRQPNAFLTPHRAGGIVPSVCRIVGWLVEDLEAHLQGRPRKFALTAEMIPTLDS
jgi:phosphoglycerate dehydrogenase-like enzyme